MIQHPPPPKKEEKKEAGSAEGFRLPYNLKGSIRVSIKAKVYKDPKPPTKQVSARVFVYTQTLNPLAEALNGFGGFMGLRSLGF